MPVEEFDELNQARASRVGAWVVLFVGVFGAGFGLWFIYARIADSSRPTSDYKTLAQVEQEKLDALKTQDTDHDGLSDYDETYVYKTSPYLTDSDSDNVSDKDELSKGTNPNCPEGQNCGPLSTTAPTAEPESDVATTDVEAATVEALLNPTPAQVRQVLIDSGVKAEDLAGIDDTTLLNLYRDALAEAQAQNSSATQPLK